MRYTYLAYREDFDAATLTFDPRGHIGRYLSGGECYVLPKMS